MIRGDIQLQNSEAELKSRVWMTAHAYPTCLERHLVDNDVDKFEDKGLDTVLCVLMNNSVESGNKKDEVEWEAREFV